MREPLLRGIFFIVRRYAWSVLLVSVLLSAGGLYYIRDLPMRSSFLDLLPPDDELLNRFKEKEEILQKADAVTLVVSCENATLALAACQEDLLEITQFLVGQLGANPEIASITYKKDPQAIEGEALLSKSDKLVIEIGEKIESLKKLQATLATPGLADVAKVKLADIYREFNRVLEQFQFFTSSTINFPNPLEFFKLPSATPLYEGIQRLKAVNQTTKDILQKLPSTLDASHATIQALLGTLGEIAQTLDQLLEFKQIVNFSKDGRAIRIDARPRHSSQRGLEYNRQIANFVKKLFEDEEVQKALAQKSLKAAYTGSYIIATDSNFAINSDMLNTTIISAIGIAVIIVLTLRRWLYPLMAMVALFVALIWTFAWAKFSVGGLNLVTSFLPSLILGLGIDYAINFIAHFLYERRRGLKTSAALYNTMLHKGGAILTASLATMLVLFGLMVARSPGLTEMGIISGMGILFSVIATLFLLPALILVTSLMSRRQLRQTVRESESFWFGTLIKRARWGIITVVTLSSLGLGYYLFNEGVHFRFVDDQLAPQNLPSQLVMREQVRKRFDVGRGAGEYFMFFTRDREELKDVTAQLQKIQVESQEIDAIFSPALFFPQGATNLEDLAQRFDLEGLLGQAQTNLQVLNQNLSGSSDLVEQVKLLTGQLSNLANLAVLFGTNDAFRQELGQLIAQLVDLQCVLPEKTREKNQENTEETRRSVPESPRLTPPLPTAAWEDFKIQLTQFLVDLSGHLEQCPLEGIDLEAFSNKINQLRALLEHPESTVETLRSASEFQELSALAERINESKRDPEQLAFEIKGLQEQLEDLGRQVEALLSSAAQLQELDTLLEKLPQDLRERFITHNNEYVIYAHIRRDVLNDREKYRSLKKQIEPIEAEALGVPMIAEQLEKSMQADFLNSTYFAVAIILVILAIGLQGLSFGPLWGIIPVGLGFLWMLAGMRYLSIDFNFANIIISSLLIGNGVDYAVYVLHSYMNNRSIEKTLSETAAPVLGSALTTMVSFGSLLFATTPGLQVFGTSALLGIGFTTFFTLVCLPALLALRRD
jgi:predicted RND superfamily exporter protein